MKVGRIRRVLDACRFRFFSDLSASRLQEYLAERRRAPTNASIQTTNFYLQAVKQFCQWLHRDGRAGESPINHLQGLNAKLDRRHARRALSVEELIWLLQSTEGGPERGRVSGVDRALLYRVAAETGLRASELASLTVAAFSLNTDPPIVTLNARYSKHREDDILIIKKATAVLLQRHFATKMPTAVALKMPSKQTLAKVMRRDLHHARSAWLKSAEDSQTRAEMLKTDFLTYQDRSGKFADFHSLRHATGTFLAAAGVSPKVAQTMMRHSDINLTMSVYSHSFRESEVYAVEKLPDLSRRPSQKRQDESA